MKLDKVSNSSILNELRRGNKEKAFNLIYSKYKDFVFNSLMKISHNRETSKELSQETFIKAWDFISRKEEYNEFGFGGWLYRIAMNNYIDFYREKGKNIPNISCLVYEGGSFTEDPHTRMIDKLFNKNNVFGDSYEDTIIENENYSDLKKTLDEMRKEEFFFFQIIQMRYFENKKYKEIAEELGVGLDSLGSRLIRANNHLKKRYFKKTA